MLEGIPTRTVATVIMQGLRIHKQLITAIGCKDSVQLKAFPCHGMNKGFCDL